MRATILWSLFTVQAACTGYFIVDIIFDLVRPAGTTPMTGLAGFADSDLVEFIVTARLFLGLAFTASELWQIQKRHSQLEDQLQIASGAFSDLLQQRFVEWKLTAAERDIAILSIKGYAIAEMAELRATSAGTVKAQCASVYRKAGVKSRLELLSLFLDDLMADSLLASEA